ncbi:hypothetical protein Rhopal_001854-T1 [Rhodotorula paludigena]|uniref:Uncharacterized protein n=1 Tax=Rhodotorula paludigena TaxID=86838 RepID=A0AAV5GJM7_9BASI|nr:hypothetical protein Rhopal_001854-T1 [Rhodotorula paludigena]
MAAPAAAPHVVAAEAPPPPPPAPVPAVPSPAPAPAPGGPASEAELRGAPSSAFDVELSEASRAADAASKWNSLLTWARTARLAGQGGASTGWDFATGMYHVPRDSAEYTAGVQRAPVDPAAPPPQLTLQSSGPLSSHNPDMPSDDESGLGMSGGVGRSGAGDGGWTESGRPRRRVNR